MFFYLIGTDHRRAPIDVRDEIYRRRKTISDFWTACDPYGTAILVTCNRLEIYGAARYPDDASGHIRGFIERFPEFAGYGYVKYGESEVFRHALRLASGLESQLQGEKEILVQLNRWARDIPSETLNKLWTEAISLSQKIRTASRLNENSDNIAALVFDDIRKKLERGDGYEIVIAGTGKIAELFARHRPAGAHLKFVAHKNYLKARELAEDSDGEALLFKDLPRLLVKADVLIGATSSPHHVIGHDQLEKWTHGRERPLYIYDLAVPRDIEPGVSGIDGVFLYNLHDLGYIFHQRNKFRKERVELASGLIEDVLDIYKGANHVTNT